MSTHSEYSPERKAIAVPPPNQQALAASRSASNALRRAAMRRWCARSNKEPPSAEMLRERVDERSLGGVECVGVDVAPVALVQTEGFLGFQRSDAVQLP